MEARRSWCWRRSGSATKMVKPSYIRYSTVMQVGGIFLYYEKFHLFEY